MKAFKKIISAITFFTFAFVQMSNSQDCTKFFPQNEGTVMVTKHYEKKDREISTTKQTILRKTVQGNELKIDIKMDSSSPDTDSVYSAEFSYLCKDGKLYIDMSNYLGTMLDAYKGMEVEINSEKLEIPSELVEGQTLTSGKVDVKIKSNGFQIMNIVITISDRKVEKKETITTPAGTFECFKITQKTTSKTGFVNIETFSSEWISEKVGVVRTENYDKKEKLISYSVLDEFKE